MNTSTSPAPTGATSPAPAATSTLRFRGDSVMSPERISGGIRVHFRVTRRLSDGNVETVRLLDPVTLMFSALSGAVRDEAFAYGLETKLLRQAALPKDTRTGKPASPEAKREAVAELAAHFASGAESWNLASQSTSLSADVRMLINALVRALGLSPEAAETAVREMSTEDRNALRVDPEIKPALDALYAEAAGNGEAAKGLKDRLRALRGA